MRECASNAFGVPLRPAAKSGADYRLTPVIVHYPGVISSLSIGDVTGDGRADVVAAGALGPVQVFVQSPSGEVSEPLSLQFPLANPATAALAEVNGDDKLDILVAGLTISTQQSQLTLLQALGDGKFAEPTTYDAPGVSYVESHDMTHDGTPDIVGHATDHFVVFELRAGGGLKRAADVPTPALPRREARGCLADVTGDGAVDLIELLGEGDYGLAISAFDPAHAHFGPPDLYKLGNGHNIACAIADFNHDGRKDVAVTEDPFGYDDRTWTLAQDVSGNFLEPKLIGTYGWSGVMAAGDLNHDGRDDLVRLHSLRLSVLLQTESGLGDAQFYPYPDASTESQAVALGDVNCDGCPDIVTANVTGLVVFYGHGCAQ